MVREPREGDQPLPTPNDHPGITRLVILDLLDRERLGIDRYGTTLQPFNGRDPLLDLYHELLDGAQYARQEMEERDAAGHKADLEWRSHMTVDLVDVMGDDKNVIAAARVSTLGAFREDLCVPIAPDSGDAKLISYLLKNRHGSPFEHCVMTFFVEAPIFVFRELMRHRIASYNEESGRYRELRPIFYLPAHDRPLVQVGKPGAYSFEAGSDDQVELTRDAGMKAAAAAYGLYQQQLAAGVAREVARMVLPLSIYSSAYVTMNGRGLMNFLGLRTKRDNATFPSFPQREIEMVAEGMEDHWKKIQPITHAAFEANGRVAP